MAETVEIEASRWRRDQGVVAAVSAFSGAIMGLLHPAWQMAIESAQVQAGLIAYPPDNPFYLYHLKLWTLSTQLPALFMYLGVGEYAANLALNAVLGALSFSALGLCCLAVSRVASISALVPLLIFASEAWDIGVSYPIILLRSPHTFGIAATSYALLTMALFGLGHRRVASFLLGAAPAVHPTVGSWCFGVVFLAQLWDRASFRAWLRECGLPLLAGVMVTALSLAHHLYLMRFLPHVPLEVQTHYLKSYVELWDGHRNPSYFRRDRPGVIIGLEMLLLCLVWLWRYSEELPREALVMLRAFAISAGLSLAFLVLNIAVSDLPQVVTVAMPWRNLNLTGLAFLAFFMGLMARYRERAAMHLLLIVFLGLLTSHFLVDRPIFMFLWPLVPLATLLARWIPFRLPAPAYRVGTLLTAVLLGIVALWGLSDLYVSALVSPSQLKDWSNDPFFAKVHAARGVVLTGSDIFHIQLRARRPVLLNGLNLNQLPYVLESAPSMDRALREVYGVNLMVHSKDVNFWGLNWMAGKSLFESRTVEQWQDIGRRYGITDIVTYGTWTLKLPRVAAAYEYALFHIPGAADGATKTVDD